ncbi:MAG TPA: AzlC family ABC transporter permease [Anaerolineales bacterium]
MTPRSEFLSGLKAELPLLIGVFPFGMIYGVLAMGAGLPAGQAQAMSAVVFAGSSQFIAAQLFSAAAPAIVIVITVAVVNLRHALYSASLAPYLKKLNPLWKFGLAYLLTDEAYAVTIGHFRQEAEAEHKQWFLLGAGLMLWSAWQASTLAGILVGTVIPASWALDFTLALTFIALVVPALRDRAEVAAALVAGVTAVATYGFPYKLGLVAASLAGIATGLWMERRQ